MSDLDPLLRPRSIAVIGASRRTGTIGYQIIDNLLRHGFEGAVYPVNPSASAVHSIPAYPTVTAIPGEVDLAVVVVPKDLVLDVAEECGRKGIPGIVVISAGFKEVGGAGVERERRLLECVREYGMRMIGPNCLGVLNTGVGVSMNATFAPVMPPRGPISFVSQSGAMGVTILDYAAEYLIGFHQFVSVGNKADVSGNDLLEYWEGDDATRVVLMYLESFGNPSKFTRIARRVTRRKPVIVVKSGRTGAGALAAASHTGALAGTDSATDALLQQCGVLRVDTVESLFDLAMAFGHLPLPRGNSVAIVTNAGGPGIILADTCESAGLNVVEFTAATQAMLRRALPEEACVRNPVDMIASATGESYRTALDLVLRDPGVDAAIAAFVPPLGVKQRDVAAAIVDARRAHRDKPILAVLMGRDGLPQGRAELQQVGVPTYIFPESAAKALAAMDRHRQWIERPVGEVADFEVDRAAAGAALAAAAAAGREHLSDQEARAVLRAYGVPVVETRSASSPEEAGLAAAELGFPVVLKVMSPDIVHKTDVGGVVVDLRTEEEVRSAYVKMMKRIGEVEPDARIDGVLVERFVRGGTETIIGMAADPAFGPVLMFGLGGIFVEALGDVVFRVHPVTDVDAREMVTSIRGHAMLGGLRGEAAADVGLLAELVQRISQLVGEFPAIMELDINPFVVFESGGMAVDARIRVDLQRMEEIEESSYSGAAGAHV